MNIRCLSDWWLWSNSWRVPFITQSFRMISSLKNLRIDELSLNNLEQTRVFECRWRSRYFLACDEFSRKNADKTCSVWLSVWRGFFHSWSSFRLPVNQPTEWLMTLRGRPSSCVSEIHFLCHWSSLVFANFQELQERNKRHNTSRGWRLIWDSNLDMKRQNKDSKGLLGSLRRGSLSTSRRLNPVYYYIIYISLPAGFGRNNLFLRSWLLESRAYSWRLFYRKWKWQMVFENECNYEVSSRRWYDRSWKTSWTLHERMRTTTQDNKSKSYWALRKDIIHPFLLPFLLPFPWKKHRLPKLHQQTPRKCSSRKLG